MARKTKTPQASGQTILLVDDDLNYLEVCQRLLEREGHEVLTAMNGSEALRRLQQEHVDLLLLDYYMPGMTGEEVVTQLRQSNRYIQVVLQTGYASEQPPRELLRRLDIQGYYDKSEGPDKLLLWADVGLKAAYTVQLLYKSRQGLRYILEVTPDLHKIQPLEDLLQGILWQVAGLLGAMNTFLAVVEDGGIFLSGSEETESFLAMAEENAELIIRASTGRFNNCERVDACLEAEKVGAIYQVMQHGVIETVQSTTIVPLRVGELTVGIIYLDRPIVVERDVELLSIFANQAAVAIHNVQLYEMATLDPLTGVYVRRFFEQSLQRELRIAFRSQQPIALLIADLDGLKRINDTLGHLAGDQMLAALGKVLRQATRSTDIVGRYGGDEFVLLLPQTDVEGAQRVGERIFALVEEMKAKDPHNPAGLQVSLGLSVLVPPTFSLAEIPRPTPYSYYDSMAQILILRADKALYQAKKEGGNHLCMADPVEWQPVRQL
ncbi:MAG: diguanylate cyclase [Chloroflexi bacterium]|nr:diguanylate cyclase [Chloroflexota bacterium]MCI0580676.1 diguanylate cyclase [Chloroflexota bacterium]MCI0644735.1 diguanylate cyclase [Chloroflexota bacterium]MCI0728640.1 diguanylate cyclase [Chloroflexota bacterium]